MSGTGAVSRWGRLPHVPDGPSDQALHRLVGWYAVGLRLWIAVAVVVAAPLAATATVSGAWLAAVLVTLGAWSVFFAVQVTRRGLPALLVLADAAVIVAMIVVHHLVVPATLISAGTTWMLPLASTAIYISQLAFPPPAGLPVAAVVTAVYAATVPHPAGALYLVIQAVATAALMTLVRRGGRNADAAIDRQLSLDRDLAVQAARLADQREQNRRLHDTILSTLIMVASGALDSESPALAAQASGDLQVLNSLSAPPGSQAPAALPLADRLAALPLADRLAAVAAQAAPLQVTTSFSSATEPLPATAVDRLADCVAEALRNVARHAGTGSAMIAARKEDGQIVVEIIDQGRGFDAQAVPRSRRGLSESIRGRMAEIGGSADISGGPGAGTTVSLRWPPEELRDDAPVARMTGWPATGGPAPGTAPPRPTPRSPAPSPAAEADSRPSALLAARYARALDIAAVVAVAGWHLAGAGPLLVAHLGSYASDQFQIAAWCAIALIITAGSVLLLRGTASRGTGWALAAAALVISTAVALGCPAAEMIETNWAWGTAGWVGVLVLLRRPLAELGVFLSLEALATFAVLVRDGLSRPAGAAFITVLAGSAGIQLAIAVAARALDVPARQAADAATREAEATVERAVAEQVGAARRARWQELRATAEPLLHGLATGAADPAEPAVQRACAVEAARLRRLLAEGDEAPDPLVHELHACADVAQRRGVAVDIETAAQFPRAQIPAVPPEGRRALTDLAIAVLVNAISRVRVTVTGTVDGVIVSLVSDSPADPDLPSGPDRLVVDSQRDQHSLWVEARWNTM